ncbi:putative disease resistance protein RGA3 [Rhododendron vialii]|uniref:putative disease resistance protein RGA3 n=1 Tax=Rhododendron vialii TaxID=182163 RepID=UPI00265F8B1C|nr:putative disease resistance protein RGA3 [Rhododendron vialii]
MAEALLIPAANVILSRLLPLATNQINLAWGFKEDLEKLRKRLEIIQGLLEIGGSEESKILVTTHSREVVQALQDLQSCTHELTELSKEDCWTMFRNKVFANGGPRETQTLLDIGRRMVEKCKGVPLAINILGGLLYSKQNEQDWESIEKSELWSSPKSKDRILIVLRLSFGHLSSPSLKQSFAYCSIFPKDHVISKDELIQLWMGLGYLQPSSKSKLEMEELGNEYFNTLWLNLLFQEVEFDEYNNITSCKMHDLVHDLALHVSQGTCLTLEASEVKKNPDVLHLCLFLREEKQLDILKENVEKLRTLFLMGHLPQHTKDFKSICALRLAKFGVEEESCSISKSIHLRFLDLNEENYYDLEDVENYYDLEDEDNHHDRRKLMPMKIGKLTSLQTLPFFVVGKKSGHRIEELGSLSKLSGKLHVYDLQHVKDKEEAKKAKILEKSGIQELKLHWHRDLGDSEMSNNNHEDVLEGLKPHRNIKGLILINFEGRRLPPWMSTNARLLQNLVKIELEGCISCEQVPALGHLPHLATIVMKGLHNLKHIGPIFYGLDEGIVGSCSSSGVATARVFPALRKFKLFDMPH